jgi:hypothetical protein
MTSSQREPDEREAANTTRDAEQDRVPIEGTEGVERLLHDVGEIEKQLWQCLSEKERANHPVTTYHLEQIASHLHSLLFILKDQREPLANDTAGQASLRSLLESLRSLLDRLNKVDKEDERSWQLSSSAAWQLSRNAAWELAGQFERQLIELGDDTYLYTLLKDHFGTEEEPQSGPKRVPTIADWKDYFPRDDLERLAADYEQNGRGFSDDRTLNEVRNVLRQRLFPDNEQNGREFGDDRIRSEARHFLRHLHLARFEDHRRDRTKLRLQAKYLRRMTPWVAGLLLVLCVSYLLVSLPNTYGPTSLAPFSTGTIPLNPGPSPPSEQPMPFPAYLLLFVFSAGALGAIFGRAFKLGRQSVYVGTASRDEQASFGIRAHLAQGQGIRAQVVLGGAAAVIIFLALQLFAPDFPPVAYGAIAFLTGYSEPFFNRMLQDTTGMGQRISGM